MKKQLQKATQNNYRDLIAIKEGLPKTISVWMEAYFHFEVTTSERSQKWQQHKFYLRMTRKFGRTKNVLIHQAGKFQTLP